MKLKAFILYHSFLVLVLFLVLTSCGISKSIHNVPDVSGYDATISEKITINDSTFTSGHNSFAKNKYGSYELFVEGNAYQIGLNTGLLTEDLF